MSRIVRILLQTYAALMRSQRDSEYNLYQKNTPQPSNGRMLSNITLSYNGTCKLVVITAHVQYAFHIASYWFLYAELMRLMSSAFIK